MYPSDPQRPTLGMLRSLRLGMSPRVPAGSKLFWKGLKGEITPFGLPLNQLQKRHPQEIQTLDFELFAGRRFHLFDVGLSTPINWKLLQLSCSKGGRHGTNVAKTHVVHWLLYGGIASAFRPCMLSGANPWRCLRRSFSAGKSGHARFWTKKGFPFFPGSLNN